MKIDTIETRRLYLRGFEKEDAGFAVSIWNDPQMGEYLPDPSIENVDAQYLRTVEALGEDEECCYLIAEDKSTRERIGTCSFIPEKDGNAYDIAYCVHRNFWRNGYATEMAEGMIAYARQQGAEKITVNVNRENEASKRIVQKLGFVKTGEKSYKKKKTDLVFTDDYYELKL